MAFEDVYAAAIANGIDVEVDVLTAPNDRPRADLVVFRAIFRGMEVHGLPAEIDVAGVSVSVVLGPVLTQQTDISQRAGIPLIFDKSMKLGVEVGAGQWLTVAQIVLSPVPENLVAAMTQSRERAQAALAFISATLDERIAQELLAEDLIFFDGARPVAGADLRELVRSYLPYEARVTEIEALSGLKHADVARHVSTGARWYLRGVQAGPEVDGVIFLWFAVEALVGTSKKRPIEEALRKASRDPADQEIGVGELHGIRSKFVHDKEGSEPPRPAKVRQAFYDLEGMVRALLRHALGVKSTWPAHSASRPFDAPWQGQLEKMWREPIVEFHEQLPATPTTPIPELSWSEMLPPLEIKAKVVVRGGQGQDGQRVRRIVEIALLEFGDPGIEEFLVEIKSFGGEEPLGDCRAEKLVLNSRLAQPKTEVEALDLVRSIHALVGRCLLARAGVPSDENGIFFHGVLSGWLGVHTFLGGGGSIHSITARPLRPAHTEFDLGEQLGAGVAGSSQNLEYAQKALATRSGTDGIAANETFESRISELKAAGSPKEAISMLRRWYGDEFA